MNGLDEVGCGWYCCTEIVEVIGMLWRYPPLPSLSRDIHVIVLLTALLVLIVSGGVRSPVLLPGIVAYTHSIQIQKASAGAHQQPQSDTSVAATAMENVRREKERKKKRTELSFNHFDIRHNGIQYSIELTTSKINRQPINCLSLKHTHIHTPLGSLPLPKDLYSRYWTVIQILYSYLVY